MKIYYKKIAFLLLFCTTAVFAFSQKSLSLNLGFDYNSENFTEDDYSRDQYIFSISGSFYYFPENFPLGLFTKLSFGIASLRDEKNPRESMEARDCTVTEIRVVLSPSFKIKLGSSVHIPISLGPFFFYSHERCSENNLWPPGIYKSHSYHALNLGLILDVPIVFRVSGSFFVKPGVMFNWGFLRAEKGVMWMNYRTTHNDSFKTTPFYSLGFGFYIGFGWDL